MPTALAVDIGGTHAKLGIVDGSGAIGQTATVDAPRRPEDYVSLNARMHALCAEEAVDGIGLSIAGLFDASRRVLTYHPNNVGLQGADFVSPLLAGFEGLPWAVERDINAGTLGEWHYGVGNGSRRFLCVVVGTGVGAGVMVNGELLRFAFDGIGDPGYVVVALDGALCPGGSRGCLEAEVSAPALARRAVARFEVFESSALREHRRELQEGQARSVIEQCKAGDPLARSIITETGGLLGVGLSTLASIFAPDTIAIAGGVAEAGTPYLAAIRETFVQYTAPFYAEGVRLELAALGGRANLAGAAAAVFSTL